MRYLTARLNSIRELTEIFRDEPPAGLLRFGMRGRIEAGTEVIVEVNSPLVYVPQVNRLQTIGALLAKYFWSAAR